MRSATKTFFFFMKAIIRQECKEKCKTVLMDQSVMFVHSAVFRWAADLHASFYTLKRRADLNCCFTCLSRHLSAPETAIAELHLLPAYSRTAGADERQVTLLFISSQSVFHENWTSAKAILVSGPFNPAVVFHVFSCDIATFRKEEEKKPSDFRLPFGPINKS